MNRRIFLAAFPAVLVAGCGFQLRRLEGIPFASLYVDAPPNSAVAKHIFASLKSNKATRLTGSATEAEAVLKIHSETRSKIILSLSGAGRVTEYRLGLNVSYTVSGKNDRALAAAEVIELNRDLTYDDSLLLAKSAEEGLLNRDMDDDATRRILRRLQSIKPGGGN